MKVAGVDSGVILSDSDETLLFCSPLKLLLLLILGSDLFEGFCESSMSPPLRSMQIYFSNVLQNSGHADNVFLNCVCNVENYVRVS